MSSAPQSKTEGTEQPEGRADSGGRPTAFPPAPLPWSGRLSGGDRKQSESRNLILRQKELNQIPAGAKLKGAGTEKSEGRRSPAKWSQPRHEGRSARRDFCFRSQRRRNQKSRKSARPERSDRKWIIPGRGTRTGMIHCREHCRGWRNEARAQPGE